ncbi:AraD1 family protein [Devosia chinhatensis]|uniref:FAH family protein n=1 Tax=Devosia chinhatensis TaxID=429727 RepID=A0A0F5FKQ4_9HYPH|nr:AraD1 family protein [Devosia chinhatensis]KKB09125.1 FAH family protein [Devosia chinhatensis]
MRLIQFERKDGTRAVGVVDGDTIQVVQNTETVRRLALDAIAAGRSLTDEVASRGTSGTEDYDTLLADGRVLPPLDHEDPAHCVIAGTGLTHIGSAAARGQMHAKIAGAEADLNDSMRMFKWGVEGGKPEDGKAGVQPEWFYKGDGSIVARPGQGLPMPDFAEDSGEEPEVVGLYVIADDGTPWRVGFAVGNETTDHVTEKKNYLYLAHAKLRFCAYGPELFVGDLPSDLTGHARIIRNGETVWEKSFPTGEDNMCHSLANLEYHHFKYDQFLRPGDVHVQFMGTSVASFGDGIKTEVGDVFEIGIPEFGRPLSNTIVMVPSRQGLKKINAL